MAITFVASSNATGSGVTSLTCNTPAGIQAGDLLVVAFAFENVASTSGPWIIPNNGQFNPNGIGAAKSWQQVAWQAPSGTGSGLEVWAAVWSSGTTPAGNFAASQNVVAVMGAWRGEYNPTGLISGAPPRVSTTAQVTGGQPPAPSVTTNVGDLVIACGADAMTGSGYGSPSGFTNRADTARSGAGTVEVTLADAVATVAAPTGPITFPNAAASGSTLGSTATLVFSPAPAAAAPGPLLEASMPPNLDLGPGYTLRVTALSTTNGSLVSGVSVSNFGVLVQDTGEGTANLQVGPYMLVPGPGA